MSNKKEYFRFTDGVDHDATINESSESIYVGYNCVWAIVTELTGIVDGPPLYTVQVSDDEVKWDNYRSASTDVDVNNPVDDTHLAFDYIRIVHNANGATTGSVKYKLCIKRN